MFRALLWKEWRELWVLPVAAAVLAAMTFFVMKAVFRQPTMLVWDTSFAAWLLLAAVYIPTHLYARERDARTIDFLSARPTNRYYLWWVWFFVSAVTFAVVGVVLCGVTDVLIHVFFGEVASDVYRSKTIATSIGAGVIIFTTSTLSSAIFKRQLSAIVATLLAVILVYVLWSSRVSWLSEIVYFYHSGDFRLLGKYRFSGSFSFLYMFSFIICPLLLLVSLILFARGSVWRSSRRAIVQAYGLSGFVALLPMILGMAYLLSESQTIPQWKNLYISPSMDVSRDGTQVTLMAGGRWRILDLPEKKTRAYGHERQYEYRPPVEGIEVLTFNKHEGTKSQYNQRKITPWDRLQAWMTTSSNERRYHMRTYFDFWTSWSLDGEYVALYARPIEELRQDGFLALMDQDENLLGEHILPFFEREGYYPIGWDYDSRYYYGEETKPRHPRTIVWRISPDSTTPEEVTRLSQDGYSRIYISPNGKWILASTSPDTSHGREYRIYDTAQDEFQFLDENIYGSLWSPDGNMLAYDMQTEAPADPSQEYLSRMVIYIPETGEKHLISTEPFRKLRLLSWSPTSTYLLLGTLEPIYGGDEAPVPVSESPRLYLFSTETMEINEIENLIPLEGIVKGYRNDLHWIYGDRLMWYDDNKLIATDRDGSNPERIFWVEDDKFYFYGEEQG